MTTFLSPRGVSFVRSSESECLLDHFGYIVNGWTASPDWVLTGISIGSAPLNALLLSIPRMSSLTKKYAAGKTLPLVAIVGRPNVGKSTLFNRLIGERRSIVGDQPGITRDRIYGESEWNGKPFALVDTGGIVPDDDALIPANILKQAGVAIEEAQALVWMVDARKGVTPLDEELARLLRGTGKRVIVAANKANARNWESEEGEVNSIR